jgi:CBS-domain-containing membrane protein
MKKVIFMLVMLFTMNVCSFAEDNKANEVERIERYDFKVNTRKLAEYLQLNSDQIDALVTVTEEFAKDLMFAATECNDSNRKMVTKNAIDKNVKHMSYVLNQNQLHKYLTVLNLTINNRRIGE